MWGNPHTIIIGDAMKKLSLAIYVVKIPTTFKDTEGNKIFEVLCAKLTRQAADYVASQYDGAFVEKYWADKALETI